MEFIRNLLPGLGYSAVISAFVLFFKMAIDTFNITGVETAILTDSKKIAIHLSRISILSIFYSLIFFFMMVFDGSIGKEPIELLIVFCASFIIVFLMVLILYPFFLFFIKFFSFKMHYYFKGEDKKIEWEIVRRVDQNKLLVLQKDVSCQFINADDIINKEITGKLDKAKTERKSWIYRRNKKVQTLQVIIFIATVAWIATQIRKSFTVSDVDIKSSLIIIILIIINCLFLLHYSIVKNNDKLIKKYPVIEDSELNIKSAELKAE